MYCLPVSIRWLPGWFQSLFHHDSLDDSSSIWGPESEEGAGDPAFEPTDLNVPSSTQSQSQSGERTESTIFTSSRSGLQVPAKAAAPYWTRETAPLYTNFSRPIYERVGPRYRCKCIYLICPAQIYA